MGRGIQIQRMITCVWIARAIYNPTAALGRYKILETEHSAGKGLWPVGRLCPVIYEAEIRWNENRRTRMNQSSV
jgi:hypothetical protein